MTTERFTKKTLDYNYEPFQDGSFDPIEHVLMFGEQAVADARTAQLFGKSHRRVHVGAALFANNLEAKRLGLFLGHNDSARKGAKKFCAEMKATQSSGNYYRKEAVVVVGPTDQDVIQSINHRGIVTATLPPCTPCREGHVDDAMLVMTVDESANRMQAWTGAGVKAFFDQPIQKARRNQEPGPERMPLQPDIIDFSESPISFWAHAREEYASLEAAIRVDSERELRIARAEVAVRALYVAAPA